MRVGEGGGERGKEAMTTEKEASDKNKEAKEKGKWKRKRRQGKDANCGFWYARTIVVDR